MNRREALRTIGSGATLGALAATALVTVQCQPVEAPAAVINPALAAAIEAHCATIRYDETLYGANCEPVVNEDTLAASDAEISKAFLALMSVPCLTAADSAAKAAHVLAGSIGLRGFRWHDEFMDALIPDGADSTAPDGPLVLFLRSLTGGTA